MPQQRNRASHLHISPRTVKQHLRILFPHAGINEGYLRTAFDKLGVWTRLDSRFTGRPQRGERPYARGQWAVALGGRIERGPGTSIFGQRSNQRKALRKRRAVVREAGMHRWSDGRLARPAGRGGRAFHRQSLLHHWIFPYAMIPVPNHSRQPTTHSAIRPRWRIPHRWWSSTYHRWQIKKPKSWSAVFSYPAFYLEILSLQSLGTETYCTPVLYTSVPASGWFRGTAGVSNVFSEE
jgi:hypothetical protein